MQNHSKIGRNYGEYKTLTAEGKKVDHKFNIYPKFLLSNQYRLAEAR